MKRILKIIALLLLIAAAGTWFARQYLLQQVVMAELKKRNIPVQSLQVDRLSKNHIALSNLSLGNHGEVKAKSADINIIWAGTSPNVVDIALQQATISASMDSNGVSLGGIETLWNAAQQKPVVGSVRHVEIIGDLAVHYALPNELRITFEKNLLTLTQDNKAMLLPLNLSGTLQGDVAQKIALDIAFVSEKNELQGTAKGSYDMATKKGQLAWQTKPFALTPTGIQFSDLSPLYAADIKTFPIQLASSGTVQINQSDWVATPSLKVVEMPLANVLASALGEGTVVEGLIRGDIPIHVTKDGWRIEPAAMNNIGGLHIAVKPGSTSAQALSSHPQAPLVLGALSNFQVALMTLGLKSTNDHGGINLNWHFVGNNPDFMGGKKVDFTLAVNANLEDILRSTASADSLVGQANAHKQKP